MTTPEEKNLLALVARRALVGIDSLPISDRAAVLEGVSLILPQEEAAYAKFAAFSLRKAEQSQLELFKSIQSL